MALRLTDRWAWDFWLATDGPDYHIFFLQSPRTLHHPDDRHWNVTIGHAVSTDLRRWSLLPDALAPAPEPAWDDLTTWTGSVVHHDDAWWMLYTGTSRAEQGRVQRIGLARSEDLLRWERYRAGPVIEADPAWYEHLDLEAWHEHAWRDPWVWRDDRTGVFHVFVTARVRNGDPATRGVIGHAASSDLLTWTVLPPVTTPGVFGQMEVPQVELVGAMWRMLFSTSAAPKLHESLPGTRLTGTHVLSADDPLGPYQWSTHSALDADHVGTRYGGRFVKTKDGWWLLAWLANDGAGGFVGEIADPVGVTARDGRLQLVT